MTRGADGLVLYWRSMILGIIFIVVGLVLFMIGGALTNDNPGVERPHAILMLLGFVGVIAGLVALAVDIFNL